MRSEHQILDHRASGDYATGRGGLLDREQESERAGSDAGGRRGLGQMALRLDFDVYLGVAW